MTEDEIRERARAIHNLYIGPREAHHELCSVDPCDGYTMTLAALRETAREAEKRADEADRDALFELGERRKAESALADAREELAVAKEALARYYNAKSAERR